MDKAAATIVARGRSSRLTCAMSRPLGFQLKTRWRCDQVRHLDSQIPADAGGLEGYAFLGVPVIPDALPQWRSLYTQKSWSQRPLRRYSAITMHEMVESVVAGHDAQHDLKVLNNVREAIKGAPLCPTGDAFLVPIEAMIINSAAKLRSY